MRCEYLMRAYRGAVRSSVRYVCATIPGRETNVFGLFTGVWGSLGLGKPAGYGSVVRMRYNSNG